MRVLRATHLLAVPVDSTHCPHHTVGPRGVCPGDRQGCGTSPLCCVPCAVLRHSDVLVRASGGHVSSPFVLLIPYSAWWLTILVGWREGIGPRNLGDHGGPGWGGVQGQGSARPRATRGPVWETSGRSTGLLGCEAGTSRWREVLCWAGRLTEAPVLRAVWGGSCLGCHRVHWDT